MSTPPAAVVEVRATPDHVRLVCSACTDRRRLPLDDVALTYGVRAFVDEHARCGPMSISLPDRPGSLVLA